MGARGIKVEPIPHPTGSKFSWESKSDPNRIRRDRSPSHVLSHGIRDGIWGAEGMEISFFYSHVEGWDLIFIHSGSLVTVDSRIPIVAGG